MSTAHVKFIRDGSVVCNCGRENNHGDDEPDFYADFPSVSVVRGGIKFPQPPPSPEAYPKRMPTFTSTGGWCAPAKTTYLHEPITITFHGVDPELLALVGLTQEDIEQNEGDEGMSFKDRQAAQLRQMMMHLSEQMTRLDAFPDRDDYADGTVIKVVVRGRKEEYTYVLLKVITGQGYGGVRWYHTGTISRSITKSDHWFSAWDQIGQWLMSFEELVSFEEMVPKIDSKLTPAEEAEVPSSMTLAEAMESKAKLPIPDKAPTFDVRNVPGYVPPTTPGTTRDSEPPF